MEVEDVKAKAGVSERGTWMITDDARSTKQTEESSNHQGLYAEKVARMMDADCYFHLGEVTVYLLCASN